MIHPFHQAPTTEHRGREGPKAMIDKGEGVQGESPAGNIPGQQSRDVIPSSKEHLGDMNGCLYIKGINRRRQFLSTNMILIE